MALSLDRGEGNAETLSLTCNTEWTATASADWLTVTPASGSGNASVVVMTNEENPEPEMRSATVTVTAGGLKKTVSVTQDAGANLSVTPTDTIIGSGQGATVTITITTDETWAISDIPDWLTISTDKGNGNATITVTTLEANYSPNLRTAHLTIEAGGRTAKVKIMQGTYQNENSIKVADEIVLSDGWAVTLDFGTSVDGYYVDAIDAETFDRLDQEALKIYLMLNGSNQTPEQNLYYTGNIRPNTEMVLCCLPYSNQNGMTYGDIMTKSITTKQRLNMCEIDLSYRFSQWSVTINKYPLCDSFYFLYWADEYATENSETPSSLIAFIISDMASSGELRPISESGPYSLDATNACLAVAWGIFSDGSVSSTLSREYRTAYWPGKPHKAPKASESDRTKLKALSTAKLDELKKHLRVVRMK